MTVELLNREEELTKTDRRILDFISGHPEEFLFSSIGQLAERLQVSEATISRFARHAGYRDFKELKQHVMDKNSGKGPAKKMAATLLKEESFRVESWLRYQQECLQKTMEEMDEEAFERAAGAVAGARRVFIHAKNASGAMGELLFFRLRRSGIDVTRIPASGSEMLEGLAQAKEGDLVVFFAFSKLSAESRIILDYQRQAGYQTLCFTARSYLPKEDSADISLYVYRGEAGEYHSMAAPAAMIDALVLAVSEKLESHTAENLNRIHQLKERYRKR